MKDHAEIKAFARVLTGIKGLDTILGGGFLKGGIYLLMGPPGAGKTILANQFGFNHVKTGEHALYISLLSESHSRLFGHLKPMSFFNEDQIAECFNYVSAYHILEKEGLDGLLRSIAQMVRQYKATLLFIDGVASAEELANSPVSFKKFVHDLNTVLGISGCTAVLLSSLNNDTHPEHTMVDGIISLTTIETAMRLTRQIQITKLRGSRQLTGRHVFTITNEGITVYPRIESYIGLKVSPTPEPTDLLSTGIPKLDEMLGGGITYGTMTSLVGAAGSGKTLLGTQFLSEGAAKGEATLYFGFYESPPRLLRKVEKLNRHIKSLVTKGNIEFFWQSPFDAAIDETADRLLQLVERHNVKRLFIDGIVGFREALVDQARWMAALTALANELRYRGVTTFFTEETKIFPMGVETPISDHSAITDNIIYLRYVDIGAELYRFISVIKSREERPDRTIFEFEIGGESYFEIRPVNADFESLFSGTPRLRGSAKPPRSKQVAVAKKKKQGKAGKKR